VLTVSVTLDDGTVGPTGATGPQGAGFNYRGVWSGATAYAANDVVARGAASFVALASSTNIPPETDNTKWSVFSGRYLSATQMVNDFYNGALGRDPTTLERSTAVAAIQAEAVAFDTLGLRQVTLALGTTLFTSAEYTARARTDSQYIDDLYRAYLGRPADSSGLAYWTTYLGTIGTRASLRSSIAASSEFMNTRLGLLSDLIYMQGDINAIGGRYVSLGEPPNDNDGITYHLASNTWRSGPLPASGLTPLTIDPSGTYGDGTHYSAVTVDPYGRVTAAAQVSFPSTFPSRVTATFTSSSLADTVEDNTHNVTMAKSYRLLSVQADRACRVRLYATAAARTADAARLIGVDPTGNHGVVIDLVFTAADTWLLAPQVLGSSMESVPASTIAIAVQNRSGSTHTVALTFTYIQSEA
jgi:hypothetical protein